MKLKALSNINSGQFNAGDEFDISDDEGQALIDAGAAVPLDGAAVVDEPQAPADESPEATADDTPLEPTPVATDQEVTEPDQPTPEQIARDLEASETPSDVPSESPSDENNAPQIS